MAWYSWALACVLLGLLEDLPFLCNSFVVNGISLENSSFPHGMIHTHHGSAMVLPLTLSSGNSSHSFIKDAHHQRERQLESGSPKTSNARMKLYDDLLTNGYYTTRLWIGSPPQEFALIVDSGSTVTYVPCSTCTQCGRHQDPRFQPELSSSYQPVECGLECNNCDTGRRQCRYERQYAEMSTSSGVLGEDIVSFGSDSALKPQRVVFGCENLETGDLYHQHADGIMGLGRGHLSIMDQLVQHGVIADSFSLCYGGMDIGGGAMILGAIPPPPDMVFSTSNPNRSPYYNIQLKEIRVAGNSLHLNPQVFNNKFGTVLDSGTTYAYLPEPAYVVFKDAVVKQLGSLQRIAGPDPSYHDICFSGAGSDVFQLSKKFPQVDLVFGNGQMVSLAPENYLFRHSKVHGAYCLGIFKNGKDPTTLLGGIVVRNMLVTYDRGNQKIGFWKTNCSELWERLQAAVSPPPPAPAISHDGNSSNWGSPVLPPASPPSVLNPGEHQEIGKMEVDMSMTVNFKEFRSLLPEFEEDLARELEVTLHQVRIMNFSNEGETVRIRWAVLPAESSHRIPNTTAERIISLLTRHQVHLRDAFGTYQLTGWKILPPSQRTWLQQHGLVLLGTGVSATVIACALLIYWYCWRQSQEAFGNYKTVDAGNLDEELQQL